MGSDFELLAVVAGVAAACLVIGFVVAALRAASEADKAHDAAFQSHIAAHKDRERGGGGR